MIVYLGRMRLTPDAIEEACQFVNPLKERELDLRAKKIQIIENLACTSDQVNKLQIVLLLNVQITMCTP